ncbi:FAD/NAD(P)-binding protein [Periweissella beninensis]|uniref:FAD/NAD(P)-binding protein n=1 Tax=Periweissella beninensis TaxID=504936 RepID=UPI0021A871CE|nr:FAD/NAD(P)-binding protein [Periweissella beninensis]MCT4396363.1 FAD-dependent oxidoreductase [Periweissella beninensis]
MHVVIIGAGPRGLITAERLLAQFKQATKYPQLKITIIDNTGLGGRVWQPNQSRNLIMNTVVQQFGFFTDKTVNGPLATTPGYSFYTWLKALAPTFIKRHPAIPFVTEYYELARNLQPNQFASRGLVGIYAHWFFENLQLNLPANTHLTFMNDTVIDLTGTEHFDLTLQNGGPLTADKVILALGHNDPQLTTEQKALMHHAEQLNTIYLPSIHPGEAPLATLPAKEPVLLRGLGLIFFDYLARLTIDRGGKFVSAPNQRLKYLPSGKEPHIIAGSRSGLPLHARGLNQKDDYMRYQAIFLTPENVARLADHDHHISYQAFYHLVTQDMQYVFYLRLAHQAKIDTPKLKQALATSTDLAATAKTFGLDAELDLAHYLKPFAPTTTNASYQAQMLTYLSADLDQALLGNYAGAHAAAFDILRDIRDNIRDVYENWFDGAAKKQFLTEFAKINNLLSVGPPYHRIQQLIALMEAGIVELAPRDIHVIPKSDGFMVNTSIATINYQVKHVVEARIGSTNLAHTTNQLGLNLLERGTLSLDRYQITAQPPFSSGAVTFQPHTYQSLTRTGAKLANLYTFGIPSEGYTWFTTYIPRPNINDRGFRDVTELAYHVLN